MEINEKEVLSLITKKCVFTNEKKEQLHVTNVAPKFIYCSHPLTEVDFDTNIECVAELTLETQQVQCVRLCFWYDRASKKISDKILVIPSNISYVEVEMKEGKSYFRSCIFTEIADYIIQLEELPSEDMMRILANSIVNLNDGDKSLIKSCRLYNKELKVIKIVDL